MPAAAASNSHTRQVVPRRAEKNMATPAPAAQKMLRIEMPLGETRWRARNWAKVRAHPAWRVFSGRLAVTVSMLVACTHSAIRWARAETKNLAQYLVRLPMEQS